jgi:hypothetical protein
MIAPGNGHREIRLQEDEIEGDECEHRAQRRGATAEGETKHEGEHEEEQHDVEHAKLLAKWHHRDRRGSDGQRRDTEAPPGLPLANEQPPQWVVTSLGQSLSP